MEKGMKEGREGVNEEGKERGRKVEGGRGGNES